VLLDRLFKFSRQVHAKRVSQFSRSNQEEITDR
jgi:hypothetical protein